MWTTAEALKGIPDLDQYNTEVDKQVKKVNDEITRLDEDNYFENMSESRVVRWEGILKLVPKSNATIEERRFAAQAKAIDKLPYTYRVVLRDLQALASDATLEVSEKHAVVSIGLSNQNMINSVVDLLEKKLPLDITYEIVVLYNTWDMFEDKTWGELTVYTWGQLKEDQSL